MAKLQLVCSCGTVRGTTTDMNAKTGTRIMCCCHDCQSFAQFLEKEDTVLDNYGATEIFQIPVSYVKITQGNEQIACVRLSQKGMYRWYAQCCNTPIGNTMKAGVPFIGLIHSFMDNESIKDAELSENLGYLQTKFARKTVPLDQQASQFGVMSKIVFNLMKWKIKGLDKPSAFFEDNGQPIVKPKILGV